MSLGFSSAGMVIPLLARERLGASPALLGGYALAFNIGYVPAALACGWLTRRFGSRAMLVSGGLLLIAVGAPSFFITNRYLFLLPCLAQGVSGGLFWPAIEGANAEGQSAEGMKRGACFFSFAWITGMLCGYILNGQLYDWHARAPFALVVVTGLAIAAGPFIPGALRIAPWRTRRSHDDHTASIERRRLFVRLAFFANFGSWVAISCVRALFPDYAVSAELTGVQVGYVLASMSIGAIVSTGLLAVWHGWHYSGRWLLGAQFAGAAALVWFAFTPHYLALCAAQFIVGAMMAMTYYASIYYGMELSGGHSDAGGDHSGKHEAVIGSAVGMGPFLGGWLIAATGLPRSAFLGAGIFVLVLVVTQVALLVRFRKAPSRAS